MLVVFVTHTYFKVEDVEADDGVVHQRHKAFDLILDFLEQLLILRGRFREILTLGVVAHVLTDRFRLTLDVRLKNLPEEVLQSDYRMIIHRCQMRPQSIELDIVFRVAGRRRNTEPHDVMIFELPQHLLLVRQELSCLGRLLKIVNDGGVGGGDWPFPVC